MSTRDCTTHYGGLRVYWSQEMNGGGTSFGQSFVPVVERLFGTVNRLCEVCAGPGFIGFSLLAKGLCRSLCLVEVSEAAVDAARRTVRDNQLESRVSVYGADALRGVPTSEKWDLVVGNPPHFGAAADHVDPIRHDVGWELHRSLYRDVRSFLLPHASMVLLESLIGSTPETFTAMIRAGGLEPVKAFVFAERHGVAGPHYFMWTRPITDGVLSLGGDVVTLHVAASRAHHPIELDRSDVWRCVEVELTNDIDAVVDVAVSGGPCVVSLGRVAPGSIARSSRAFVPPGPAWLWCRRPLRDGQCG